MSADTIFAQIARKEAPAFVIYEDDTTMAFLDIFPQFYGQTIVIPKQPTTSKYSEADTKILEDVVAAGQKVAKLLEGKLDGVLRCLVVIEGFDVDYLHIKLYPAGLQHKGQQVVLTEPERAPDAELKQLQKLILG